MSTDFDAAEAAAEIAALQERLTIETARADSAAAALAQTSSQLIAVRDDLARIPAMEARLTELEKLLAPPPPTSEILTVTYSDGRIKYAASDGSKYPMASDANHRNKVLSLMKIGLGEVQAEMVLHRGDEALKALMS